MRDKRYQLKLTEIFPVNSNVIHNDAYLRGWDGEVSDDSEVEGITDNVHVVETVSPSVTLNSMPFTAHEEGRETSTLDNNSNNNNQVSDGSGPFQYEHSTAQENEPVDELVVSDENLNTPVVCSGDDGLTLEKVSGSRRGERIRRKPQWLDDYC